MVKIHLSLCSAVDFAYRWSHKRNTAIETADRSHPSIHILCFPKQYVLISPIQLKCPTWVYKLSERAHRRQKHEKNENALSFTAKVRKWTFFSSKLDLTSLSPDLSSSLTFSFNNGFIARVRSNGKKKNKREEKVKWENLLQASSSSHSPQLRFIHLFLKNNVKKRSRLQWWINGQMAVDSQWIGKGKVRGQ